MSGARVAKFVRNTAVSIGVLLVLAVGGGVAYTWYMGQQPVDTTTAIAEPVDVAPRQEIKPPTMSPDAAVSASVQMLTSPIMPGDNASITVKTNPKAVCSIVVEYDDVASNDSGLSLKTADEFGNVSWSWTVEPEVPLGTWPVDVTCAHNEKSAMVRGDVEVTDKID